MIKSVPFSLGHLDIFEPGGTGEYSEEGVIDFYKNPRYEMVSMICDSKVISILGILPLRIGTAEVWLLPSVHVSKYKLGFFREVGKLIESFTEKLDLKRVQATVREDFTVGIKFLTKLGFMFEGRLNKYDNGVDHYLMARF